MSKKLRLILLIGLLIIIWGFNAVTEAVNDAMGPAYPRMIEYRTTGQEGQLVVLGTEYRLAPGVVQAVEKAGEWREQLAGFLEKVEEIVKKYGRHAQEMMRRLPGRNEELPL